MTTDRTVRPRTGPLAGIRVADFCWMGVGAVATRLRTEEGRNLAERLIAASSVVSENFAPAVMERWGLTYERPAELSPGVIYARMSSYGHSGPHGRGLSRRPGGWPAHRADQLAQRSHGRRAPSRPGGFSWRSSTTTWRRPGTRAFRSVLGLRERRHDAGPRLGEHTADVIDELRATEESVE